MVRMKIPVSQFRLALSVLNLCGFTNITPETSDYKTGTILCGDADTAVRAKNILKKEKIKSIIIDNTEVI